MEFKAEVGISIFNSRVNTANIRIAIIISASIIVIARYWNRSTSIIFITVIFVALIIIVTSIGGISDYTSFIFIASGIVTFIRANTLIRDIGINTSRVRAAIVLSTFIIIITFYIFVFTRPVFSAFSVTSIDSTFVVIITVNFNIIASIEGNTRYRITSIFPFTFIIYISTSKIFIT
jgi:hypothetical protein